MNNNWSTLRPRLPRPGHERPARTTSAAAFIQTTANPTNAVFNLQGILSDGTINEFKFGYNAAPTEHRRRRADVNGIDFSSFIINLSGSVANTGIAGQGASSGSPCRAAWSASTARGNGRGAPYDPYSLTFVDSLSRIARQSLREVRRRRPR